MWAKIDARMISAAALIVAGGTIFAFVDDYRFWASAGEIKVVASTLYKIAIPEQRAIVRSIERKLKRADAIPEAERTAEQDKIVDDLEEDLEVENEQLQQWIKERAMFKK